MHDDCSLPRCASAVLLALLAACSSDDPDDESTLDAGADGDATAPDAAEPDADAGCSPVCAGRACGPDGCGGTCGECGAAMFCDDASGACVSEGTVMVPADDGVGLSTFVVLPAEVPPGGVGALLERTPYGFPEVEGWPEFWQDEARLWASRGYAGIVQDVRGRGRSEGEFEVFRNEVADGRATTAWITAQPWSNGRVGTIGGSYGGFTALATAAGNPDVVAVVADDPAEDERSSFEGGVLNSNLLSWLYLTDHGAFPEGDELDTITNALDLLGLDQQILGREDAYWEEVVRHESLAPFPPGGTLDEVYETICAPSYVVYSSQSGWWDAVRIWDGLQSRGCRERRGDHRLVLTPDSHTYHLSALLGGLETPVNRQMLDFIDHHLGERAGVDVSSLPAVQVRLAGQPDSIAADDWTGAGRVVLHLGNPTGELEAGVLSADEPLVDEPAALLVVDPEAQDPCLGEAAVATYASERMDGTITIVGSASVTLTLEATSVDADVIATLYEVRADDWGVIAWGAARARFRDAERGPQLLEPGTPFELTVRLQPATHRVESVSHLVLLVSGAECGYVENPHTGEPAAAQTRRQPTTLSIQHGTGASRLELPVLE